MKQSVRESSFIALSFQLNCLRTSNNLSLGGLIRPKLIYFLEHFTIVSSLNLCDWIQLTLTDVVFSRITLVSCFCAENEQSWQIPESMPKTISHQKIHGAKGEIEGMPGGPRPTPGAGPLTPRLGEVWPPQAAPRPPSAPISCLST